MCEEELLCFLGDLKFLNINWISFLILNKTVMDGLLELLLGQDAPYHAMVAILSGCSIDHIYVEHKEGEFSREGVEYPEICKVSSDSGEEEEVVKVDCLFDDDEEVLAARMKKKSFLANRAHAEYKGLR